VNWGHEPQYLHNVRKVSTGSEQVSTIAGSIIPGIFERSEASSLSDHQSSGSGTASASGSASGTIGGSSQASGSAAAAVSSSAGSSLTGGSKAGGSAGTAGTAVTATATATATVAASTSKMRKLDASEMSAYSGSLYDGYYSFSSDACPVCPNRRQRQLHGSSDDSEAMKVKTFPMANELESSHGSSAGGASVGKTVGGMGGSHGGSHGGSKVANHNPMASASHYVNGHESGKTDTYVKSHIEHSSFDDGFAVYARFFKPIGITVRPDGKTIWIADAGNNKIRNISCAGMGAPTFDPTAEPTALPTLDPTFVPTAKPSFESTMKPSNGAKTVKAPPAVREPAPAVTKSPSKAVKGASASITANGVAADASTMSTSNVTLISVIGVIGAGVFLAALYFRKQIMDAILGSSVSDPKQLATSESVEQRA